MNFYVKVHRTAKECVVAACDENLMGAEFSEGIFRISVTGFYRGAVVGEREMRAVLRTGTILNLVGNNAVAVAIDEGVVDRKNVKRVSGVAYAQAVVA